MASYMGFLNVAISMTRVISPMIKKHFPMLEIWIFCKHVSSSCMQVVLRTFGQSKRTTYRNMPFTIWEGLLRNDRCR